MNGGTISKGHCIICHNDGVELSDEHVIPEAIGGYIHCYKVCKNCNSSMGEHVDTQLVNHFFVKWLRYIHQLKGKNSAINNPLVGDAELSTGEKVRVEDNNGVATPRLLPQAPVIEPDKGGGMITVDMRDEKLIPTMQQKLLKKLGVNPNDVRIVSKRVIHQIDHPEVKIQKSIDLKNFKIGFLKIAYEICVELFPEYENDPLGQKYAEILYGASTDRLDDVRFLGDGFNDALEPVLSQFIDYTNKKRHIIVVFNNHGRLSCFVKLFDVFNQLIEMSDTAFLKEGDMRFYFNNFSKHNYEQMTLAELVERVTVEKETGYKFDEKGMELLSKLIDNQEVGFRANGFGDNIVYDHVGVAIMTEETLKIRMPQDRVNESFDDNGNVVTTYSVPKGFFFKVSPTDELVQLVEINNLTEIHKF